MNPPSDLNSNWNEKILQEQIPRRIYNPGRSPSGRSEINLIVKRERKDLLWMTITCDTSRIAGLWSRNSRLFVFERRMEHFFPIVSHSSRARIHYGHLRSFSTSERNALRANYESDPIHSFMESSFLSTRFAASARIIKSHLAVLIRREDGKKRRFNTLPMNHSPFSQRH